MRRDGDAGGLGEDSLPILRFERDIVNAVRKNEVTVVIGETGSGKTTQLSQILLDNNLADRNLKQDVQQEGERAKEEEDRGGLGQMIAVTQPRRVAAVTVARRVAWERGGRVGGEVGYAVRFEEFESRSTKIKYLTDGMLLRETLRDPLLSKYGVVILDEAHERSLNTDILFGLLKTILLKRRGRRLSSNSDDDAKAQTKTKKDRSKSEVPADLGPLKLLVTSATLEGEKFSKYFLDCPVFKVPGRCYPVDVIHLQEAIPANLYVDYALETVLQIHLHEEEGDILVFMTGQAEIEKAIELLSGKMAQLEEGSCGDLLILPLYAALPPERQAKVFSKAPTGCRKCIVATNIAETSLTVQGITFVVDAGFVKQKEYDPRSGLDSLKVCQISKVQAIQRAGRAGRTRPGKCYRLYTKDTFEMDMAEVTLPEIKRISLVGAILHLKSLALDIDVLSFDFLDKPETSAIVDALKQLYILEAIDADGEITALGRRMAQLPLDPPLARAIISAQDLNCLEEVLTIASMLSADRIFVESNRSQASNATLKSQEKPKAIERLEKESQGDHILLLRLYNLCKYERFREDTLRSLRLSIQGMRFVREIRKQLAASVQGNKGGNTSDEEHGEGRPRKRHKLHEGVEHQHPLGPKDTASIRRALAIGFANRLAKRHPKHNGYRTLSDNSVLCQVHPGCAPLREDEDGLLPSWIIYHELLVTSRPFLSKCCPIEGRWVDGILHRIEHVDVKRLSGGRENNNNNNNSFVGERSVTTKTQNLVKVSSAGSTKVKDKQTIDAARLRYLQRKQQRMNMQKKT